MMASKVLALVTLSSLSVSFVARLAEAASSASSSVVAEEDKMPNVLWILLDDVSAERFPDSGNLALEGLLPGFDELKSDGAVYYPHFYSPSSLCAPSQVSLFSGMEPGQIGGQFQFTADSIPGKADYATVPPPEVVFVPERLRSMGYWSVGVGKLDYQVGDVMPTFYDRILGGVLSDTLHPSILNSVWEPAVEQGRPFFGMINMMDVHQLVSALQIEAPIPLTDPDTGGPPADLPFGRFGYARPKAILYDTGPNGTAQPEVTSLQDLEGAVNIVGYVGDMDEESLSHANGGVPGYLPEDDVGIRSILARECDLIRNVDYRLRKIVSKLKKDGVYDDTMIVVFGDHGSALHKAKSLLQPQSVRPPLWIKYPKGTQLSPSVVKDAGGNNVDERMTCIADLYPTLLSVLKQPPNAYMAGRALAGDYEDARPPREMMFALLQRVQSRQAWKTFAAFTKDFHYQRDLITRESIEARAAELESGEFRSEEDACAAEATILDAYDDSLYSNHYTFFSAAPLFHRLRKLMRLRALDPSYPSKYYFLAADGARPPAECMYDLQSDPAGTENLLMEYTYSVGQSSEMQKWGNNVTNVTLEYGSVDMFRLGNRSRMDALASLRSGLDKWIDTQAYVTGSVDWSDGLWGEENRMAAKFWPNGTQPHTAVVAIGKPRRIDGLNMTGADLACETPGAIFRFSSVTATEREGCEQLGARRKEAISPMSLVNSGLPEIQYKSPRNGRNYTGYEYGKHVGRTVFASLFVGQFDDFSIFVSSDGTFLEIASVGFSNVYSFDTRDSVWNGTDWDGVDSNGEWLGDPVTVWDDLSHTLNFVAFNDYVFGPNRDAIFSGMDEEGGPFESTRPDEATSLNKGYNPAPSYFACPTEDVTTYPTPLYSGATINAYGWSLVQELSWFRPFESNGLDDKGSMNLAVVQRSRNPPRYDTTQMQFNSFQYECLPWNVGTLVPVAVSTSEQIHIFAQAVRKGFADSLFSEIAFNCSDIADENCEASRSIGYKDGTKDITDSSRSSRGLAGGAFVLAVSLGLVAGVFLV